DGELPVLLDGIVLEILVPSVAVRQEPPGGVALADAGEQGEAHGRALDVEGLVVLDDLHGREGIEPRARYLDGLAQHLEPREPEEFRGLIQVLTRAVHGKGERLEAGWALPGREQLMVKAEEESAAVHAAREEDAQRLRPGHGREPQAQLLAQGTD